MNDRLNTVEIYRRPLRHLPGGKGQWRWRFKSGANGKIMATGSEGYRNLEDLLESMAVVLDLDQRALPTLDEGLRKVPRDSGWHDVLVVIQR
jgi:hypothetical protein